MKDNIQDIAKAIKDIAVATLDNKKGMDVTALEVTEQTVLADYFVLATGTSNTHVRALTDEVEFQIKEQLGVAPDHIEGAGGNSWTLMDYGCVIVNIFTTQAREFYKLERLWNGAEIKPAENEEIEE